MAQRTIAWRARPPQSSMIAAPALAGIVLHRLFVMGETPGPTLIEHVIDQIILPAVRPEA